MVTTVLAFAWAAGSGGGGVVETNQSLRLINTKMALGGRHLPFVWTDALPLFQASIINEKVPCRINKDYFRDSLMRLTI